MKLCYNNADEPHLDYNGDQGAYMRKAGGYELPRRQPFSLLKHMHAFNAFIEDFVETGESVGDALALAWRWHCNVVELSVRTHVMTGLFANAFFLSWVAFCKLFHAAVKMDKVQYDSIERLEAEEYAYCRMVSEQENPIVSARPLSRYTVNEVWCSMQQIVPSLYAHPFSRDMKLYLHALFFRYCDLFCAQQPAQQIPQLYNNPLFVKYSREKFSSSSDSSTGSSSESQADGSSSSTSSSSAEELSAEELSAEELSAEEEEDFDGYKRVSVPIDAICSLRSEYFYEGQVAFFSQLRRVSLVEALLARIKVRASCSEETLTSLSDAMVAMLNDVATNDDLKKPVAEDVRRNLTALVLFHGETERFRMRSPHAAATPNEVLAAMRPHDNNTVITLRSLAITEMLANTALYERELVLITRWCTEYWLRYKTTNGDVKEMMQKSFLMEEFVSLADIDARISEPSQPFMLRLMRHHFICHKKHVYHTAHFVEAYFLWFSLCVRQQLITSRAIHPKIKTSLRQFSDTKLAK
jgi:hypothetical protein